MTTSSALAAFERTVAEARRAGLEWSMYGVDARAMVVTTAYEMGEWDRAASAAAHDAETGMPAWAAASIDAAAGGLLAARGQLSATELLAATRPWWADDGRTAVQSGIAAVDLLGGTGDVDRMLTVHDEVVDFLRGLWGRGLVAVEVRLAALAMGHLATALRTQPPAGRHDLLDQVDRLWLQADAVWGEGSLLQPPLLEGRAWQVRARAERERARWAGGDDVALDELVARWREVVELFEQYGERYEAARSRWRLAEVLLAAGDPSAVDELRLARETAQALGARPLLEALEHLTPRSGRAPSTLTARESEVLGLLAEGRSNGEIGRALFISTKTASVHVSNILAKLGAASRGEAVAVARASGLLEH